MKTPPHGVALKPLHDWPSFWDGGDVTPVFHPAATRD